MYSAHIGPKNVTSILLIARNEAIGPVIAGILWPREVTLFLEYNVVQLCNSFRIR